jgi:hypothetical protein
LHGISAGFAARRNPGTKVTETEADVLPVRDSSEAPAAPEVPNVRHGEREERGSGVDIEESIRIGVERRWGLRAWSESVERAAHQDEVEGGSLTKQARKDLWWQRVQSRRISG